MRRAVIGAVGSQHLWPAGVQAGHPYGVLDRLRAACREQHVAEPVRRDLDDQARRFAPDIGGMGGCKRTKAVGLFLDGRNDARVLVAEVREDQLRAEVHVRPAVGVDYVAAGAPDEGRDAARPLLRPRMEDQFVEIHRTALGRATAPALHEGERGAPAAGLPKLRFALVAQRRQLVGSDQ